MANLSDIPPCTVVIKLGTSSIVHETTHQPLISTLSAVVETVVELRNHGHRVVLVSSGAIGVGLKRMDMDKKPASLSGKQALAAIGQGRLIALWDNLFNQLQQPIAQILLTRGDISERTRYLNAVNTFNELLSLGVVPIVNENDTVSVSEIKFGDNDTLSAITSSMIHADYLFLLTDVDGLYTSNPRKNPNARQIEVVDSVADIRNQVSTTTLGSSLGTGGMTTKLIAADIATAAGVTTIITSSKNPKAIFDIISYDVRVTKRKNRAEHATEGATTPPRSIEEYLAQGTSGSSTPIVPRPPHTVFTASRDPLPDITGWTNYALAPAGTVIISSQMHRELGKGDAMGGGRLLPSGVVGVIGPFAAGQAVRVSVLLRDLEVDGDEDGHGLIDGGLLERMAALRVAQSSRPVTPTTAAILKSRLDHPDGSVNGDGDGDESERKVTVSDGVDKLEFTENDVLEVGRGLANYNSAQILAVKGLTSKDMPKILGYADSEYVVENITVRVSPSV